MKTLILRAEYLPLEEKVDDYYVTNSNMQEVFFYNDQLEKLPTLSMLAAFLRRYPTNNMLKKMRAKFVKEHGEEEAEKLLAKEETEIEQALDLYVLRGYYSWSAMMVSLKDGHVYEYCADSQHTLPRSRFIRREHYEQWRRQMLGHSNSRVPLGGALAAEREKRDTALDKSSTWINGAFLNR
jgi:hypothetical protein